MKKRLFAAMGALTFLALCLLGAGCNGSNVASTGSTAGDVSQAGANYIADVSGGAGGLGIEIESYGPLGVTVLAGDNANAGFSLRIPAFTPNFGAEGWTVAADCTVATLSADPDDNNVYYFLNGLNSLYHKKADGTIATVTGIKVQTGATLTLSLNQDSATGLELNNDLEILGTLKTADYDSSTKGTFTFNGSGGIFVRAGGKISTAGTAGASGAAGQNAGSLSLISKSNNPNGGILLNQGTIDASGGLTTATDNAGGNGGQLTLYSYGYLINTGAILANGGNGGTDGGSAYPISSSDVYSASFLYNTGTISLKGGNGTTGTGGNGPTCWSDVYSEYATTYNSGAIDISGGDGGTTGGSGGKLWLANDKSGDMLNSGKLSANGGNATSMDNNVATFAGVGGRVEIDVTGNLVTSGDLSANGGSAANQNSLSSGGNGGTVEFKGRTGRDKNENVVALGMMYISGNLSAKGGSGPIGGAGGYLYAHNEKTDNNTANNMGGIRFLGYSKLTADGGDGAVDGANGASIHIYTYDDSLNNVTIPSGPIVNEAILSARGGNGLTGSGGGGGDIRLQTANEGSALDIPGLPVPTASNSGAVTVQGGNGELNGGQGGSFDLFGSLRVACTGAVNASGGANMTDSTSAGGRAGFISISATSGNADVSGALTANGGDAMANGGTGGNVSVSSAVTSVSGAISAAGGTASISASGSSARAGSGGVVELSSYKPATSVTGAVSVAKGPGGDPLLAAYDGYFAVDMVVIVSGGGLA